MADIPTTAGPVAADDLGVTLVHEHLLTASEAVRFQWPHLYDPEAELARAVEETRSAQRHGVQTICDPSCMDLARDVRLNARVTQETGMRFVMATGIYGQHYTFLPHFFQSRDVDFLADAFVHDLEVGIQGTDVRAGFLKCACDEPGLTDDVQKVHRAVAQASLRTGAPIMAHSRPASRTGLDQMALFAEEGVDPAKVQVAHTGDTDDLDYVEELLETGCFIGMDRYGLDIILPTEQRNATVLELARRGHTDRMMLGQDACATIDWYPEELVRQMAPKWRFALIFDEILPALLRDGLSNEDVDTMLVENPRRWLGG
jgi:phosphotriesterase-related protein